MIPLKDWEYSMLNRISEDNCTNYNIKCIDDEHYIKTDDLMNLIDETQHYREYAEEKLTEVATEHDKKYYEENCNSLQLSTIKALNELHVKYEKLQKENEELKQKMENIQSTLNEDDYDRLIEEGIELWEN